MDSELAKQAMLYSCWLLDTDGDLQGLRKRHLEYVEAAIKYFFDHCKPVFAELKFTTQQKDQILGTLCCVLNLLLNELDSHYYVPPELITE